MQPDIAPGAAGRILGGVSEASEDLHTVVGHFLAQLGAVQLGHRNLPHAALAAVQKINSAIDQPAPGLYVRQVLCETVAPNLELADRLAERRAFQAILERVLDHTIHSRQRADRSGQPLPLEVLHDVVKAAVQFTEDVPARNAAFVEEKLSRIGAQIPDL